MFCSFSDVVSQSHTNFVNCVKYSPDGEHFVSGGADGQVLLELYFREVHVVTLRSPHIIGKLYNVHLHGSLVGIIYCMLVQPCYN